MATLPTPQTVYGVIMPDRTLKYLYTSAGNFSTFLDANGPHPGGGTPVAIGYVPPDNPPPNPPPSGTYKDGPTSGNLPASGVYSDGVATLYSGAGGYVVTNKFDSRITETLWANGMGDWKVTAIAPAGNGSVLAYPAAQVNTYPTVNGVWHPIDVSVFKTLTSSYAHVDPSNLASGDDYEFAYDIWMADSNANAWSSPAQEVMVWTDTHGSQRLPAGNDTGKTWTDPTYGDVYKIWSGFGGQTTSLVRIANVTSGSVDLLALLNFLKTSGYITQFGIEQLNYGAEICSTSGIAKDFVVTNLTYTAVR